MQIIAQLKALAFTEWEIKLKRGTEQALAKSQMLGKPIKCSTVKTYSLIKRLQQQKNSIPVL